MIHFWRQTEEKQLNKKLLPEGFIQLCICLLLLLLLHSPRHNLLHQQQANHSNLLFLLPRLRQVFFSAFSTPASAPSSSSLFATPTTPAPSGSLFGTSGSAQLTTPFGTASTPTLASTPAPGFGTSTSLGGTSLFSTPFGGGATASGSSFSGASKGRSKPRGRR